jgi:hypothetical protein
LPYTVDRTNQWFFWWTPVAEQRLEAALAGIQRTSQESRLLSELAHDCNLIGQVVRTVGDFQEAPGAASLYEEDYRQSVERFIREKWTTEEGCRIAYDFARAFYQGGHRMAEMAVSPDEKMVVRLPPELEKVYRSLSEVSGTPRRQ